MEMNYRFLSLKTFLKILPGNFQFIVLPLIPLHHFHLSLHTHLPLGFLLVFQIKSPHLSSSKVVATLLPLKDICFLPKLIC